MEYRYVGKSGLYASRISLGGVQLGSEDVSQSQVDRIIAAMFDVGINIVVRGPPNLDHFGCEVCRVSAG